MMDWPGGCAVDRVSGHRRIPADTNHHFCSELFAAFANLGHLVMDGARLLSVGVVIRPSVI